MDCVGPVFNCLDQHFAEVFKQEELRIALVNQDRILRAKHVGTVTFLSRVTQKKSSEVSDTLRSHVGAPPSFTENKQNKAGHLQSLS